MQEEKEKMLYEVSYHLIPSLSPEEALTAHEKIVAVIEGESGSIKSSQVPQERELSYEMTKEVAGKKVRYTTAHFAHVIFEAPSDAAPVIGEKVKNDKSVLRHLLISLPKEALMPRERKIPGTHKEEVKKVSDKEAGPVDETSIDKTIDELVIE